MLAVILSAAAAPALSPVAKELILFAVALVPTAILKRQIGLSMQLCFQEGRQTFKLLAEKMLRYLRTTEPPPRQNANVHHLLHPLPNLAKRP